MALAWPEAMGDYRATVSWELGGGDFVANRYTRAHRWLFDGGVVVPASASPAIVPLPHSVEEAVDPEEAFVAALSSCHMLFFLSLAAEEGIVVTHYRDEAVGTLARQSSGRLGMTRVELRPAADYGDSGPPSPEDVRRLHHAAHEACFIANSVNTEVCVSIVR